MVELIIKSDPSGAEVIIDGEVVGTTPLAVLIEIGLEAFRAECITGGVVSCDWDTLHTRLIDHNISRLWWDLTEQERRSIAEMAIKNTLYHFIKHRRKGKPNCEGGEGDWEQAFCVTESIIRYQKFDHAFSSMGSCYWRRYELDDEHCFVASDTYNLPCFMFGCYDHSMCGIQVVQSTDSLDNWIVFQYDSFDIKPGSWQMPYGTIVQIQKPYAFHPCGGYSAYGYVATFELPSTELVAFRNECLSNGSVLCDWNTLKTRLEDNTVSRLWWDLTQDERRSIALEATKNTLCFRIYLWRTGQLDCIGGEGIWSNADCGINSVVRIWKFGTDSPDGYNAYWQHPSTKIEYCYVPDTKYNLPCYSAAIGHTDFGHEIATIQIGEDVSDINSWIFFQYNEWDIRPGESSQFPTPSTLHIKPYGKPNIVEMDVE